MRRTKTDYILYKVVVVLFLVVVVGVVLLLQPTASAPAQPPVKSASTNGYTLTVMSSTRAGNQLTIKYTITKDGVPYKVAQGQLLFGQRRLVGDGGVGTVGGTIFYGSGDKYSDGMLVYSHAPPPAIAPDQDVLVFFERPLTSGGTNLLVPVD